jgi:hypothetical protein
MNQRRSNRLISFGAAVMLISVAPAIIKIWTELEFGNLASDPNWIRPVPARFEQFILGFPARTFFVALVTLGVVMLLAGYIGRHSQKSN